jgi:hypothetical protein
MTVYLKFLLFVSLYFVLCLVSLSSIVQIDEHNERSFVARFLRTTTAADEDESLYTRCTYEGHCMNGYTCVKSIQTTSRTQSTPGICRPYFEYQQHASTSSSSYSSSNSSIMQHSCVQSCLHHVQWNEQFYYEAMPNVTGAELALSDRLRRPPGCLVRYHRHLPFHHHAWTNFSLQSWQYETREKRVVRTDPIGPNMSTATEQEWAAFCYSPCQHDFDCGPVDAFACVDTTCKRREESYWKHHSSSTMTPRTVIVSGTSSGYFSGLRNLAGSVQFWAPNHQLVVYNLGMSQQQLAEVETWKNVKSIQWRHGWPSHFPPHVREGKKYAWKSIAINESLHEYKNIFWLDAGSTLVGPINEVERIVQETGMFLVHGQDLDMKMKSNAATYSYLGYNKSTFVGGPHFGGGTQAHMFPSRYIDTIVKPNAECAFDVNCISPGSSSLASHRYDQTSLSILAYQPHVFAPHHTEYLASSKTQLNRDLHNSSGRFIIWTARQACKEYAGDVKIKEGATRAGIANMSSTGGGVVVVDDKSPSDVQERLRKKKEKLLKDLKA